MKTKRKPVEGEAVPELYRLYRPTTFDEIVGQKEAVATLSRLMKTGFPHAVMLHGHSGAGKTTMAGICARELGCVGRDFREVNCAAIEKPLDTIRSIHERMNMRPRYGTCTVFVAEEIQALSKAGFAQQAMLRMLENTPSHVYFILCTTDPSKVLHAIRTRCTEVKCRPLSESELVEVMEGVVSKHLEGSGRTVPETVYRQIAEVSDGSARKALVLLKQVMDLGTEEQQLAAIVRSDTKKQAIDLARLLMSGKKKPTWKQVTNLIESIDDEPETVRMVVLNYAAKKLMGTGSPAAYLLIDAFRDDYRTCGVAGLVASCFSLLNPR